MNKDPFADYYKIQEPNKRYKGYAWSTAIGLQAVDGLETSDYLKEVAVKNIEGEISIDDLPQPVVETAETRKIEEEIIKERQEKQQRMTKQEV